MELYQLRTFATVAKTGHLTKAAEQLATSQSAVSAQIKALEEEFDMPLFIRTAKGMLLNASGKVLLEQAKKVLAESELLLHRARTLQTELVGTIRIGLSEDENFLLIEQLCNLAATKYGRLKFDILNSSSHVILQDIIENKLDCGFIFGDFPENKITGLFLRSQRIMVAAPIAWKDRILGAAWEDLLKLPWAWHVSDCAYRKKAIEFFKSRNLDAPESLFSADRDATILAMIASGTCLGLVKEPDAIQAERQEKVVIWQGDHLELDISFVFKQDRQQDPLIQAILKIVRQIWEPDSKVSTKTQEESTE